MMFKIPGEPQGKARPRVTRHGTYTPPKTRAYESKVEAAYIWQVGKVRPINGAVEVAIVAYFSIPKSYTKKKRAEIAQGRCPVLKKPDCDNIAKAVTDALNGIAYKDDAQITSLTVAKNWTDGEGYVICEIRGINGEQKD